jgi:hypothetical protein
MLALAAGIAAVDGAGTPPARTQQIPRIDARIVARNIPGHGSTPVFPNGTMHFTK